MGSKQTGHRKTWKFFKDVAFSADIETNSKVVDLLLVTLI